MNIQNLTTKHLLLLSAIEETGSLAAAARLLKMNTQAANYAMKKMRAAFDDPLVERDGKNLRLTRFAENFVRRIKPTLPKWEALLQPATFNPATASRDFTIQIQDSETLGPFVNLPMLFPSEAPHCRLNIRPPHYSQSPSSLHGQIDLYVGRDWEDGGSGYSYYRTDPRPVFIHYDAGTAPPPDSLDTFLKRHYVNLADPDVRPSPAYHSVNQALGALGITRRRPSMSLSSFSGVARAIRGTDMIYLGTDITPDWAFPGLSRAPVPFEIPSIVHLMQWSAINDNDPGHIWLRDIVLRSREKDEAGNYRITYYDKDDNVV